MAAKALGHSHPTCRSGLKLLFITLTEKGIVFHGKEDTLSPVRSKSVHCLDPRVEPWIFTGVSPTVAKRGKGWPCSTRAHSSCPAHIIATKAPFLRRKSLFLTN